MALEDLDRMLSDIQRIERELRRRGSPARVVGFTPEEQLGLPLGRGDRVEDHVTHLPGRVVRGSVAHVITPREESVPRVKQIVDFAVPSGRRVPIYLVELDDGRLVARTEDELEGIPRSPESRPDARAAGTDRLERPR